MVVPCGRCDAIGRRGVSGRQVAAAGLRGTFGCQSVQRAVRLVELLPLLVGQVLARALQIPHAVLHDLLRLREVLLRAPVPALLRRPVQDVVDAIQRHIRVQRQLGRRHTRATGAGG